LGGRGRRISEFEASLVSSRTTRATQRNPVSKKTKTKYKQTKKKSIEKFPLIKISTPEIITAQHGGLNLGKRLYVC